MLTEIQCEAFRKEKKIPFFSGLNIIQGVGNDLDGNGGNSIGKTSMLKIIDYTFGGKYYAESNEDVIRNIGQHDICFTHVFNDIPYYFRRSASKPQVVLRCSNEQYSPISELSIQQFCDWLTSQYRLKELNLSFRSIVGLYSRIWNKPNKEVNRPLYNHNAEPVRHAIISLVKLFGRYDAIKELDEQEDYLQNRQKIISRAVSYHLIQIPSKQEYLKTKKELSDVEDKIAILKTNIEHVGMGNYTRFTEQSDKLYERHSFLLMQQSRERRSLQRCRNNMQRLLPLDNTTFGPLLEFFPDVNIEHINEIQKFHDQLRSTLLDELKSEELALQQRMERTNQDLAQNERDIQNTTGLPLQAAEAANQMLELAKRREHLQAQIELYDDKETNAAQKAYISKALTQLLNTTTIEIQNLINKKIVEYSGNITTSNSKAPILQLSSKSYQYGVKDNTGTGKAYTDLLLFDLAILSLTSLPILIHDSFLFNNIDDLTKQNFIRLYSQFPNKQIFISLDNFYGNDSEEIDKILYSSTRLVLSGNNTLFGKDWRKS